LKENPKQIIRWSVKSLRKITGGNDIFWSRPFDFLGQGKKISEAISEVKSTFVKEVKQQKEKRFINIQVDGKYLD
jgi:hypothetical protein